MRYVVFVTKCRLAAVAVAAVWVTAACGVESASPPAEGTALPSAVETAPLPSAVETAPLPSAPLVLNDIVIPEVQWCDPADDPDLTAAINAERVWSKQAAAQYRQTMLDRAAEQPEGSERRAELEAMAAQAGGMARRALMQWEQRTIASWRESCLDGLDRQARLSADSGRALIHPDQMPGLALWKQRVTESMPVGLSVVARTVMLSAVDAAASGGGLGPLESAAMTIVQAGGENTESDLERLQPFISEVLADARLRFPPTLS